MRTFERKDNLYIVKFSGADFRQCVAIMHTLENAHFSSANKYWVCEVSEWNRGILIKSGFKDTSAKIVAAPTFIAPQETKKATLDMSLLPKELFQYQIDGVKALEEHGGKFMVLDDMGCIYGDAIISTNRAGITRKRTIKDAYTQMHKGRWRSSITTYIRGLKSNNRFGLLEMETIIYKGNKLTYTLKTESGKEIRATNDHKFLTSEKEYVELGQLKIGDFIYTNGDMVCPICGTTEDICKTKIGKWYGYCRKCMYTICRKKTYNHENRRILHEHDGYVYLLGDLYRNCPNYNTGYGILEHVWVMQNHLGRALTKEEEVHHINRIRSDNRIENLIVVSKKEHMILHEADTHFTDFTHKSGVEVIMVPRLDKVVSVEEYGYEPVYDIVVKDNEHNFVANGFVVHNCGKTPQAVSYCALHPEFKKILVVCPGFIKTNWQREIKKWIKEPSTILSGKTPYSLESITTRFIIINYDIISSWEKILLDYAFDLVIGDEAQYVANHTAQRTKAFVNIARSAPKRILLSGTLMRNRPSELFTSLNLISPTNFPNRWKFLWRYCDPKHSGYGWEFKGATNKEELAERMKYYYIRRMKKDVLKDLPQKQRNVIIFDMSDTKQKEYADASEKFQQWAENANKKFVDGKACIETLRQIAYLGKREYAIEWIQDFLESGKKLIVFVYHREAIKDVVGALGDKCVSIDGGDSQEDRQVSIDRFQNDPSVQVLVGQIQACGVGLTLTAASDVAFLEFPWSPADVVQAEDRVHRIGQTADKVSIWYLVSERTVDEEMALMIQEKYHVIDTIMDGGKSDPFFGQDIIAILLGKQHEKH